MKFTIQRQYFLNNLLNVSRAIPSKSTIPVLTGIKLSVDGNGITLVGSDATISIESFMSVHDEKAQIHIETYGEIILPSRLFVEVIKKLPADILKIEVDNNFQTTIISGQAEFKLNGISGNQYPHLPIIELDRQINLPTTQFKQLINQTIFSASNQESRPILTGLHLTIAADHLEAVATDSHRLSKREIPVEVNHQLIPETPIILPKKTVVELSKIIEDDTQLNLVVTEQQVVFLIENLKIYSRLLEGLYPDTSRLIPNSHQTELVVNMSHFIAALERASLMSHESKINNVQLKIENQIAVLFVRSSEIGLSAEQLEVENITGDDLTIAFNPDYMKEALKAFGDINVKLQMQNSARPILISAEIESEVPHNLLLQLLTPVRTHYN